MKKFKLDIDLFDPEFQKQLRKTREIREKDPYSWSSLPDYLELDSWRSNEGILLLAGISPSGAIIDYSYENFAGARISGAKIRSADLLSVLDDLYTVPSLHDIYDDIESVKHNIHLEEISSLIDDNEVKILKLKKHLKTLEELKDDDYIWKISKQLQPYEKKLTRINRIWESGNHNGRNSKEYYIKWAAEKNIAIEWLGWAQEKGYFNNITPGNTTPSEPQGSPTIEKNNLLKTIAALSILIADNAKGGKYGNTASPNKDAIFNDIDALLEKLELSNNGLRSSSISQRISEGLKILNKL